jgi:hypothetical protein
MTSKTRCAITATLCFSSLALGLSASKAEAQIIHSDIQFSYAAGKILVDTGQTPGVAVGEFPVDGFFKQFDNNPGFASEGDVGFGINPHDTVYYNVLENLTYWDGSSFQSPAAATQIRVDNNGAPDTIIGSTSGAQPGAHAPLANGIGQADGLGNLHSHLSFFLEPNPSPAPAYGVYGLQLSLSSSAAGITASDPFFIAFNFGLSESQFVDAVQQYASLLVPGIAGDFNNDNDVDGQDFLVWQRGEVTNPPNNSDLTDWINSYGTSGSPIRTAVAVPEPATGLLMLLGSVCALLSRHRTSNQPHQSQSFTRHKPGGCLV